MSEATFVSWEEMSHKDQLAAIHYDFYKDVHNIRPRWIDYDAMTEADLEAALDQLKEEAEVQATREKEAHEVAIKEFNQLVEKNIAIGATDRKMAIRWIIDNEYDVGYVEYQHGLPYGYLSKELA